MSKQPTFRTISTNKVNMSSINESQVSTATNKYVPHFALQTNSSKLLFKKESQFDINSVGPLRSKEIPSISGDVPTFMKPTVSSIKRNEKNPVNKPTQVFKSKEISLDKNVPHFMTNTEASSTRIKVKEEERESLLGEEISEPSDNKSVVSKPIPSGEIPHFMTNTKSSKARYTSETIATPTVRSAEIRSINGSIPHFMTNTESSAHHISSVSTPSVSTNNKHSSTKVTNEKQHTFMLPTKASQIKADKSYTDEKNPEDKFILSTLSEEEKNEYNQFLKQQLSAISAYKKDYKNQSSSEDSLKTSKQSKQQSVSTIPSNKKISKTIEQPKSQSIKSNVSHGKQTTLTNSIQIQDKKEKTPIKTNKKSIYDTNK